MNDSTIRFSERAAKVLTDLADSAALHLSPRPDRIFKVAPGASVAWDDNCDGQLWSRLVTVRYLPTDPLETFPGLDTRRIPNFLATVELGVIRRAAVMNDLGVPPSERQITDDGIQALDDMSALLAALKCSGKVKTLIGWTPVGPEGGYHGGTWTFTILLPNCLEC